MMVPCICWLHEASQRYNICPVVSVNKLPKNPLFSKPILTEQVITRIERKIQDVFSI